MNSSPSTSSVSPNFEWTADYDGVLEQIATTDIVESISLPKLRDIIKYKINQNTQLMLQKFEETQIPTRPSSPTPLASGGLRLPPFSPRKRDGLNLNEAPKSYMNEHEANELKGFIFAQLHEFEESPPFTIQRVCELCLHPNQHYKSVGKYLRAVEKSLLVTSSWNAFPPEKDGNTSAPYASISMCPTLSAAPTTPLFSPIPFLHDDARRSKSRSPPPSPLTLHANDIGGLVPTHPLEQKVIGLVDELDDPSPGHMSEHPTALTSVTTTSAFTSRPFLASLEQRFTRARHAEEDAAQARESDAMLVDETEDKENKG